MISIIPFLMAMAFVITIILNSRHKLRCEAAMAFSFIQGVSVVMESGDHFYHVAAISAISLLVFTIYQSAQQWAKALGTLLGVSLIVNLLGILNVNVINDILLRDRIDLVNNTLSFFELFVLLAMATGRLDGISLGLFTNVREYMLVHIFSHRYFQILAWPLK